MRFGGIADTVKRMRKSMLCEPLSWTGHTRKWYRFGILECIFSDFVHKRIVSEMRGTYRFRNAGKFVDKRPRKFLIPLPTRNAPNGLDPLLCTFPPARPRYPLGA